MTFGKILRDLRGKEGIGIKRLAPRLGVSYTYLSKLENDKLNPSEEVILRVAAYYNYDRDELLLASERIPEDVRRILRDNPKEAVAFLRSRFGAIQPNRGSGKLHPTDREPTGDRS